MNEERSRLRASRVLGVVLVLLLPLAGAGAAGVIIAIAAAVTAYNGARAGTVYGILVALLTVEIIYAFDMGVLSLSYVIAALLLLLVQRIVTVTPWRAAAGWHAGDALRTFAVAGVIFFVMSAGFAVIGRVLYGYTDIVTRWSVTFTPARLILIAAVIAVILVVMRRIDTPFRRRITFGS